MRTSRNPYTLSAHNERLPVHQGAAGTRGLLHSPLFFIILSMPLLLATFAIFLQWQEDFGGRKAISVAESYHVQADRDFFPRGTRTVIRRSAVSHEQSANTKQSEASAIRGHTRSVQKQSAAMDPAQTAFQSALLLKTASHPRDGPQVCIATTTSDGLDRIIPWLRYHRTIGITKYYLFAEGKTATPPVSKILEKIPDITLILPSAGLNDSRAHSRIWNETWLGAFFDKPCNHALFVRQNLNLEIAIKQARSDGMGWMLHIDTDELLYPGGSPGYSIIELLASVKEDVHTVVFPNYEAVVETDTVTDPFTQVNLFKRNFDHVVRATYFGSYREVTRSNPNYFLTYGNGKSAARIVPGLRPNGAHRFSNYNKPPYELKSSEGAVLHYTYAMYQDVANRKHRCPCPMNDAALKKCFILDFDREAFKAASTKSPAELRQWYVEHVVWTDRHIVTKLIANGLFQRIYTPQVIMQGLSAAFNDTHDMRRERRQLEDAKQPSEVLSEVNTTRVLVEVIETLDSLTNRNSSARKRILSYQGNVTTRINLHSGT